MQMKPSYTFSGHTDYFRRFGSESEYVGDVESGKAVFAWRDGLWIVEQHSGASTSYLARRISARDVVRLRDTKSAREALARVVETLSQHVGS